MNLGLSVENAPIARVMSRAFLALKPPPKLTVSEWAQAHRRLSRATSAEPGRWNNSRTPYTVEPMDALSDPATWKVVCCFAVQTGKTESMILNALGYFIDQDPAPILLIQPRIEDARSFSKVRVAGMLRDTPVLQRKIAAPRTRGSENTILEKVYPGGRLLLAGANSPAGLAGNPIRVVLLDEIDRFGPSAKNEGDPCELAIKRTTSFGNRIVVMASTPTDTVTSRIWRELLNSDFRQYWVPCPHCGEYQLLVWNNVVMVDEDPKTAVYVCVDHCGSEWTESQRHNSVLAGEWKASREFDGVAGFHLNSLYSLWPNTNLKFLAKMWVEASGAPLLKKTFTNTVLALPWDEDSNEVTRELPTEEYPRSPDGDLLVPKGVVVITAGVDTQDNRLEITTIGWGAGEESWALDHRVFFGEIGEPHVWEELWQYMTKPWATERGPDQFIDATCVDTGGHYTQAAYKFCKGEHNSRFRITSPDGSGQFTLAIKGASGSGQIWHHTASYRNTAKVALWPVRVDPARDMIYGRLEGITEPGPGYCHFPVSPNITKNYFEQLKSHRCITKIDPKGFPRREWHKKNHRIRDEIFDCTVYAYAGLCALYSFGLSMETREEQLQLAAELQQSSTQETSALVAQADMPLPGSPPGLQMPTWTNQVNRYRRE